MTVHSPRCLTAMSTMVRWPFRAPPGTQQAHPTLRLIWLMYLPFLFMPALIVDRHPPGWLLATVLSILVFLPLYLWATRAYGRRMMPGLLAIAALGYALHPLNPFAETYLIYSAALAPLALPGLLRPLLVTITLLAGQLGEDLLTAMPVTGSAIPMLVCLVLCVGNAALRESRRKNEALHMSHQEIRRLAAIAERERIGRDLHDLLGHTLSLIAIKSELAGKLLARDREAATCEVADVMRIARDALRQVRVAVTGMRAAALEGEIASARALLESSGLTLTAQRDGVALPCEIETALAMIIREATTNIQRHAAASAARIEVRVRQRGPDPRSAGQREGSEAMLIVSDDGRGGISARGTGLSSIGERVRSLGGTLEIRSPRGGGTMLRAIFPLESPVRAVAELEEAAVP